MFLTDCQSILQSLQSPGGDQMVSNIRLELSLLMNKTSMTLQWIPSHCGVGGNEEADWLSKMGGKLEQSAHPMSYSEAKTILSKNFKTEWRQRLDIGTEEDSIHQLDRTAQVTIFRLKTGHCQLFSHPHTENFPFRRMSMRHRSSNSQPHPAVLPCLQRFEPIDMVQSGGYPQEALWTG